MTNAPDALQSPAMLANFRMVRARTLGLTAPLSAEDCCAQSMPEASPVKWHLAHTTWFFETFVLAQFEPGFVVHHPAFRILFNSYYNGVGDRHARAQRGMLTRPSQAEVLDYRADIDVRIAALLARQGRNASEQASLAALVMLGLQHEQQHQELIMTDVMHLLSTNPLHPAYNAPARFERALPVALPLRWHTFEAGVVSIGHAGDSFCFDNETPCHRQFVERFVLASRLVTNGEFRAFVDAGCYRNAALWLADGWDWVCANNVQQPLYWQHDVAQGWQEFTLRGLHALDAQAPVAHVCLYEADAYARWAGARLPSETEWECAVADAAHGALVQVDDSCWQWTSSSYAPYPGYAPVSGTLGEYNGKFMVNQYVLRGGSKVTAEGHSRRSYRNFFPASARWQFSGIRLARTLVDPVGD